MDTVDGFFFTDDELQWLEKQAWDDVMKLNKGLAITGSPASDILVRWSHMKGEQSIASQS